MVAQPAIYAGFFASGPEGHAWISQHVHKMRIDMVPAERHTRPLNFVHVPLLFPNLYPAGKDPSGFGLIMPFSKHRSEWLKTKATDTHSGKHYSISLLDPKGRTKKIEVKCYGNILGAYRKHPEAKFLGSDGEPCNKLTRGLPRRSHIVTNRHRYIGKETSRRWEQGDDLSLADFHCAEYSDGPD
jgi:hypothetical protein